MISTSSSESRKVDPDMIFKIATRAVKWLPVLIVATIIATACYAYMVPLCIKSITSKPQMISYMLVGAVVFSLLFISFTRAAMAPLPTPPDHFRLNSDSLSRLIRAATDDESISILNEAGANLPVMCRSATGALRYCAMCMNIKPDRCHHCSSCERCVLRMDHHCPWLNNCVSFTNYKFFVLTLLWGFMACMLTIGFSAEYFVKYWTVSDAVSDNIRYWVIYLFLMAIIMGVSQFSLLSFHLWLISKNKTTLENYRYPAFANGPQARAYDHGLLQNFRSCFGSSVVKALLPIHNWSGDGVQYEPRVTSLTNHI